MISEQTKKALLLFIKIAFVIAFIFTMSFIILIGALHNNTSEMMRAGSNANDAIDNTTTKALTGAIFFTFISIIATKKHWKWW